MTCISKDLNSLDDLQRRTLDMRKDLQAQRAAILSSVFTDSRGGHDVDWGTKQCRNSSKVNTQTQKMQRNGELMQCMMLLGMVDALQALIPVMQQGVRDMQRILVSRSAMP